MQGSGGTDSGGTGIENLFFNHGDKNHIHEKTFHSHHLENVPQILNMTFMQAREVLVDPNR